MPLPFGRTEKWRYIKSPFYNKNTVKAYYQLFNSTYYLQDQSGNGNTLTLSGSMVNTVLNIFRTSTPVQGFNASPYLSRATPIVFTSPWTVNLLFKRNNLAGGNECIICINRGTSSADLRQALIWYDNSNLNMSFGALNAYNIAIATALRDGNTHMLTLTSSGGDVQPKAYVDGVFMGLGTGSIGNFTGYNNSDTYIGYFKFADAAGGAGWNVNGNLTELVLDQREWSSTEIQMVFKNFRQSKLNFVAKGFYVAGIAYLQSVADSVTISDTKSTIQGFAKTITESITAGEAYIKAVTRSVADSVTTSDIVAGTKVIVGAVIDGITTSDAYSYLRGYSTSIVETITLTDTKTVAVVKAIIESTTIGEAIAYSRVYFKTIGDSFTLADAVTTTAVRAVRVLESITVEETLGVLKNGVVVSLRFFAKYAANAISTAKKYFNNP